MTRRDGGPVRVYLAGPMTGLPEFNYPAFHRAAAELRARGFVVENPAENEPPPCGSWEGWMRQGIGQLVQCDCVALLPGWGASRGARMEVRLAVSLGVPVRFLGDLGVKARALVG